MPKNENKENNYENEKSDEEKPLINLNEKSIKSENNSEQISLLDIDENEKRDNLDEVLEIPAFLRRQANWEDGKHKKN